MATKGLTGITDMLNLPSLDEVLKQNGLDMTADDQPEEPNQQAIDQTIDKLKDATTRMSMLHGLDHADKMDDLYREIIGHAQDLMAYGFNVDGPRARGFFEIAATMYGHAMSAANSKRDAQLKTMRLELDRKKVELEERRTNHVIGQNAATIDDNNTIVVEDRNELIERLRLQMQQQKA